MEKFILFQNENQGISVRHYLSERGLSVVKDVSSSHMHHKFALVDAIFLINGSFNWTRSASKYNNENIAILTNPELTVKFIHKFEEMWRALGTS